MLWVFFGLILVLVAGFAYRAGLNRGRLEGYQAGMGDGVKKGHEDGMKAGLKAGIKEHMVTTLVDAKPVPGMHEDLHQQVKEEVLKAINTKPEQKKASAAPKPGLVKMLWEEFGGWLLLALFVLLLVYLFRSG
jgi:Flagellar biosynthesis/type III secretory pathway protein